MLPQSISIIISVYKDVLALSIVLEEIMNQTVSVDEIIISEDGNSKEMEEFVSSLKYKNIVHVVSQDEGWRKNRALNKAIMHSSSEYLIFIDGDVVPHKSFVEGHITCSKKRIVCAGKRSALGEEYSKKILNRELSVNDLSKNYFKWIRKLHDDKIRHYEDGIYVRPDSFIFKYILSKRNVNSLIGCNFSCYKEDIISINGFDENYINPSLGEDDDIYWRFKASGIKGVSCRNTANQFHLWHKKGFGNEDQKINKIIFKKTVEDNQYICLNGIKKLTKNPLQ